MTNPLRAGIVGVGFMGAVHANSIRAAGGSVARVVGSTRQSSLDGAVRLRAEAVSSSIESLVHDPDVDVIHVCAPNWLHYSVASLALEAGKPVVCEKPLAITACEAESLSALADEVGVVAVVPFVYRFHPMVREARARVSQGVLGEVGVIHGTYLQDWLASPSDTNWRVDPELGGSSRAFADIGVHWCDLVEFVSGHRIVRLAARFKVAHSNRCPETEARRTEDAVSLAFETDLGAIGTLVASQVAHGRKNALKFSLDGAMAAISFDQEDPDKLWLGNCNSSAILTRGTDDNSPDAKRMSLLPPGHSQGYQDAFNALMRDTYDAIAGRSADGLPTFADGLRASRITDAVLTGARTGEWVEVSA
jgi:predicted dehydrogenase